jgi:hypothetical protein
MKARASPTLFIAAALLASSIAGATGTAAAGPSAPARTSVAERAARNRARAEHAAERRVALIDLPPGARVSRRRPSGVGARLNEAAAIPGGHRYATAHRFWTVPRSAQRVFAWLRAHRPPRTKAGRDEIRSGGGRSLEFELLPGPPHSGDLGGILFVTVVNRSSGGSAVRADAFEDWNLPRPFRARIPNGSRFLSLRGEAGSGGSHAKGEPIPLTRFASTQNRSLIAKLVRIVNRQPADQETDLPSCGPEGRGSEYHLITLIFKASRHGRALARVIEEIPIGLCDPLLLKLGRHETYALEGGWNVLRAAHGLIRRAATAP